MLIHIHKPHKATTVSFEAELLEATNTMRLVCALWKQPRTDLGYVVFEPGDLFFEYYYTDHWYAIFEIRSANNQRKGWYCNIAYPAEFTADSIHSTDLLLDLFISADGNTRLRLDIEEFETHNIAASDPLAYHAAYTAFEELEVMVQQNIAPFIHSAGEQETR
jgi:protein associated with RNAse G/E